MTKKKVKGVTAERVWVWVLRLLAAVGVGVMVYLSSLHYKGLGEGSFCDLGGGLSCSEVNTSEFSKVLGIPVAFGGLGYFVFVLLVSFVAKERDLYRYVVGVTLLALPFSLYLTGTEIFLIKSICLFCELSKGLMVVMLGLAWWRLRGLKVSIDSGLVVGALILGLLAAGASWWLQTRSGGVEEGYPKLAACLTEKGVVMYGSQRCSVCGRVRRTFGESFEKINEIECHPREEGAETELCFDKQVKKTPTFVIEDGDAELGRLQGYQSPEDLAAFAGCEEELGEDKAEE